MSYMLSAKPAQYELDTRRELNMTVEKERPGRDTSPVHLHVDEETPVHVHVVGKPASGSTNTGKKTSGKNNSIESKLAEAKSPKSATGFGASNLRRNTAAAKNKGPWVPPPGKTSSNKYAWQGASHRLEINTPGESTRIYEDTANHDMANDLDTEDEDKVAQQMRKYEEKIDTLTSEVGTLKSEVDLQRSLREADQRNYLEPDGHITAQKGSLIEKSRRLLEEQERELQECRTEILAQEFHTETLRKSLDHLRDDANLSKVERDHLGVERDILMKKLVEVEMDGQAAAKQLQTLRDFVRRLREENRMSQQDAITLNKQKELLLDRLADFELTNRTLRAMLRERHEEEATCLRLAEQRDLLLKKLSETEDRVQHLRTESLEKDRSLMDIEMTLSAQKQENLTMSGLQSSLEGTRAHLQKQLRQKEADCNRMAVQIRSLESQLAQERIDVEHLNQLLQQAKGKADKDKDALKKATRVQKQRATKSEDALEQMNAQLLEREQILSEQRAENENLQARYDKVTKEKSHHEEENTAMRTRLRELESQLSRIEDEQKLKTEHINLELHDKTSECARLKLDSEHLRSSMSNIEDKLVAAEQEVSQLRSNLRQYETLVDEYRGQLNRSRREADEAMIQLEEQKRETNRVASEGEQQIEKVKSRLQARVEELEPLPEVLKSTELRLQDAHEKLLMYERKATQNTQLIAELTAKLDKQGADLDRSSSRGRKEQTEKQHLAARVEAMDRRLKDLEAQNRELLQTVAKREEAVHQANMRLDEKARENASLSRQLEQALTDTRRHSESVREQSVAKDRSSHARLLDLEAQLSQSRAEIARCKREKEEMERKFNSRLYDLKDRLDQSHSTNRSMQNYVQFLKNSYANVFGDSALSASPLRGPSTFH